MASNHQSAPNICCGFTISGIRMISGSVDLDDCLTSLDSSVMRSKGCVMKIYKDHIVFIVPILLLIQIATAQQQIPAGSSLVTSPRPLADAARSLQETYGKVVTYEEPILTWRGELQAKPGHDPEGRWELFPTPQSFLTPQSGTDTDLATALDNTITAYHEQT